MRLNDLISATDILAGNAEHLQATGPLGVEIAGLAVDSRQVAPGFLFAALPGTQVDGRDYIPAALKAGAAALLLPEGSRISVPSEVAVLTAANPRRAERLKGAQVLLVDDVMTSGATGTACVSALKRAGAGKVVIACFARVLEEALEHAS